MNDEQFASEKRMWGETDDNFELVDAIWWRIAQWICQHQGFDGVPCDDCYLPLCDVLDLKIGNLMSEYAQAAYRAGREGKTPSDAAAAALRTIGQPIRDALLVEESRRKGSG